MCHWTTEPTLVLPPRRDDVVVEELDGEAVLFDPRSGNTYRLNETALAVWRSCDGRATTRDIALHLAAAYAVEFEVALDQVEQVAALFAQALLLDVRNDP